MKAFDRLTKTPRYFQIQTRLTSNQEKYFRRLMEQTGATRAELARQLIARGLDTAGLQVAPTEQQFDFGVIGL